MWKVRCIVFGSWNGVYVFEINKVWNAKEEWRIEMNIYWEGRKLDLLDCAFFAARLHHRVVEHSLDGSLPP